MDKLYLDLLMEEQVTRDSAGHTWVHDEPICIFLNKEEASVCVNRDADSPLWLPHTFIRSVPTCGALNSILENWSLLSKDPVLADYLEERGYKEAANLLRVTKP